MWMGAWEDGTCWGGSVGGWRIWERIATSSPCGPRLTPSHLRPLMQVCCVCTRVSRRCAQTDMGNAHRVECQRVNWPHIVFPIHRLLACEGHTGRVGGPGCAWAGAVACGGCTGHVWGSGSATHIEKGRGACVRSWLGLGHVKGAWDTSGMAAAHREGVGCVEMHWDASKGTAACV